MSSSPLPRNREASADQITLAEVRARINSRFGLVPSFFMMADEEPPIVNALFGMAEFAYFDSPLPALFKERLFTYVSRFCSVPYCMARHCGFLLGRGNVAGDAETTGVTVEHALAMLRRPFPTPAERQEILADLRAISEPLDRWPDPDSETEDTLFLAAAVVFVMPTRSRPLLTELSRVLGPVWFNYLMLFLSFIRFAHFWTETHGELRIEGDMDQLLTEQRALADWISRYDEVVQAELGQQVRLELRELELLRNHADELENRQQALQEEITRRMQIAEAAEAASLAKSGFMATMSHELRTPLNAILGYVDLLEAGVAGELGEKADGYVSRIKASARHQQQIVEEILTFSRLEAGREKVEVRPVDLADIQEELEAMISPLAAQKGLDFRFDFSSAPDRLITDPGKLRQILLNLLGNAVKFTEQGSVVLTVRQRGEMCQFIVEDTGPGIAEEDHDKIFEPFAQGDESNTRAHGGTGLGLAIVRRLADLLDGSVQLESQLDKGTRFIVEIPA